MQTKDVQSSDKTQKISHNDLKLWVNMLSDRQKFFSD